jgi:hypothetical protein
MDIEDRKEKEDGIARKCGIDEGKVIIDIPGKELLISEPRIKKMNVNILDGNELKPLSEFTPLSDALQMRGVMDWAIMVCSPEKYRDKVGRNAERVIF